MFDWFGKAFGRREYPTWADVPPPTDIEKIGNDMSKVLPEPEKPAKVYYRLGVTDNNRVAFSMGMYEITMNRDGIENLITQLSVFRDQLHDEVDNETPDA